MDIVKLGNDFFPKAVLERLFLRVEIFSWKKDGLQFRFIDTSLPSDYTHGTKKRVPVK